MNVLEKMKLTNVLKNAVGKRNAENNPLKKLSLAKEVQALRKQLGLIGTVNAPEKVKEYADTVVLNSESKFLLVQRALNDSFKPSKWWIPGGHIEANETAIEAAKRELKEETGIQVKSLQFLEKATLPNGGMSHRFVCLNENNSVTLQKSELNDYAWVSIEQLNAYDLVGELSELTTLIEKGIELAKTKNVADDLNKMLALPENPSRSDLGKAVEQWLKENVQGKVITTSDGKKVRFNRNDSTGHLTFDGRRSELAAKSMTYILDVFEKGKFNRREELLKVRNDGFVAFHCYQKRVQIDDKMVLLEAKAGEKENGELEALAPLIAYHQKIVSLDSVKEKGHFLPSIKSMDLNGELAPQAENGLWVNNTPILDSVQPEYALLTILEITDLNGNPISLDNEQAVENAEITPLVLSENATNEERYQIAFKWLNEHIQGKTITAVDGKRIYFNRNLSSDHLAHNARQDKSGIVTQCIPFIADVFKTGKFIKRQELTKQRNDGKVAFHIYEKTVKMPFGEVDLEAKACEYADGRYEANGDAIAYNLKLLNELVTHLPSNLIHQSENALGGLEPPTGDNHTPTLDSVQEEMDYVLRIVAIRPLKQVNTMPQNIDKSQLFNYNPEKGSTASKRQKANKKAIELVKQLWDGSLNMTDLTAEQKIALSEYSGNGGGLKDINGNKGSQYEYYTPKPIAAGMWELLKESGFTGGKVLDPCAGTGIFAATAPENILMENVELDKVSGTINQAIFGSENHKTTISAFEDVAINTPDEQFDAVITNVPFGDNADRGGNQFKDNQYQDEALDSYFILRALKKLKPNGLAVFMCSTRIMTGKNFRKQREMMSELAEFIGAYRLPNKVFHSANADTITDVLVFKKHSVKTKERINEVLKEDTKSKTLLQQANVLWKPFIDGLYFKEYPQYVLGSLSQVKGKYGLQEAVENNASVADIAKLMKRFGGSRIDWEMLQSIEGELISYQDGDTVFFDGVLKVYQNGVWQNAETADNAQTLSDKLHQTMQKFKSPLQIIEENQPLDELLDTINLIQARGMSLQILPDWTRQLYQMSQ